MKTLKKVLSLVLVVAMIASMLIVGAAAAEETKYPEAAAVISAIKVMEGDERGMRYGDTVTREEAAAIICRTILGDAAETLYTSSAPFADVAATRWSAKYISYLKAKGIVSGVSDTEFDPTAPVTGIAFAKMLLTAVGYGKGGEFEGAQWEINTISFANTTGLFEGSAGVNVAAAATREQCMLYAFNTITDIPAVNYNASFGAYYVGSNPFSEPQNKAPFTLAATTFNLAPGATTPNEYGRPAATWTVNGLPVVNAVTSVAPVATYTNGTTAGAIYAALGKAVVDNATFVYTVNGANGNLPTITNAMPSALAAVGGLGDTVELYSVYNGNGTYTVYVVAVTEFYGVVKSAVNGVVTLVDNTTIDGTLVDVSGIAKTDFVLYTKIGNVVKTVKEVTPVSLTYTANKAAANGAPATIVADGATYALRCANPYTARLDFGIPYDLYFDSFGNIVKMVPTTAVATEFNYVFVNRVQAKITSADLIESATNKVAVSVAYPTGGVAVVEAEIYVHPATYAKYILVDNTPVYLTAQKLSDNGTPDDSTDDVYETNAQIEARLVAAITTGWHTYTVGANGGLNFNSIAVANGYAAVVPSLTVAYNSANVGVANKAASPATVLTTVDAYGNATVKTGYASFPMSATYTNALITFAKGSNTIANIYAVNVAAAAPAPALVYCVAVGNNIATGTEYTVVGMDGVAKSVVAPAGQMTAKSIYTLTAVGDGTYTAAAYTTGAYGVAVNSGTAYDAQTFLPKAVATVGAVALDYFTDTGIEDDIFTEGVDETVAAIPYYFDAYTVVVDCTGNGATAVSEGDVFVATVNTAAQNSYYGLNYCSTIWIIG